jgi:hypothetical protein
MSQLPTKSVSIQKLMWEAAFNAGFNDVHNGVPFDCDRYHGDPNKQWSYERGRQFAIIYAGPVKNGKKLRHNAVTNYHHAVMSGYVI